MNEDFPERDRPPLVNSDGILCPRCEVRQDILIFKRLQHSEKYEDVTECIYKCPQCRFVFAPISGVIYNYFND
jgi:rubredoxin